VPEIEVLVVEIVPEIYGAADFTAANDPPSDKLDKLVKGNDVITFFSMANTLPLYAKSFTPPTSEIVPDIPLDALVTVVAANRRGLPLKPLKGT
jgi:hypothetical protein